MNKNTSGVLKITNNLLPVQYMNIKTSEAFTIAKRNLLRYPFPRLFLFQPMNANTSGVLKIANNPRAAQYINMETSDGFKIAQKKPTSIPLPTPIPVAAYEHEH
jgi:hypothetical protein